MFMRIRNMYDLKYCVLPIPFGIEEVGAISQSVYGNMAIYGDATRRGLGRACTRMLHTYLYPVQRAKR